MSAVALPFGTFYETVPASTTAQVLGTTGAAGDTLQRLIVTIGVSLTGTVSLIDGSTAYTLIPASSPLGIYSLEFNAQSQTGAWKITTGAGATVFAVGNFT